MSHGQRLRVLKLLIDHGPLTGACVFKRESSLPRGTIYTTLRRLEDDKLVISRIVRTGESGPPRRFYTITSRGLRYHQVGAELAKIIAA